ncbi:MAG TPA: PfkB family carbohydrate kinase [Planctomycetaceae bacterium]|nr:PfkB family carbohydrate kinase [Planctomycetaceae bacterium]
MPEAAGEPTPSKIVPLERLAQIIQEQQAAGRTVVHCHGVFDPLHVGHIRHFKDARRFGDVVVVTVTPDRFVNKGPHRPVFTESLRAEAIAALSAVDYVGVNEWPTAVETIQRLKPNVFVKGSEFRGGKDLTGAIAVEAAAVNAVGGRMEFTDEIVFSASNLVNRHLSVFPPEVVEYLSDFAARYATPIVLESLQNAAPLKVLVLGETIIDDYQYVEAIGKSPKDPALVVKALHSERFAGGAAAVANHVAGFCRQVTVQSCLGDRNTEEAFVREKLRENVEPRFLYRTDSPTIVKRQFIDQYFFHKLFEVYEINDALPMAADSAALVAALQSRLTEFDLVIVADSGHGMLTREVVDLVCRESRFVAISTQVGAGDLGYHVASKYPRADYVSLAENELRLEARDRRGELKPMLQRLSERLNCPRVVVTRGSRGCLGYSPQEGFVEVPAFATRVVDRLGAGDAFLAITALCAVQKCPLEILGFIGNVVGSQAVAMVGNRSSIEQVSLCRHIEHLLK